MTKPSKGLPAGELLKSIDSINFIFRVVFFCAHMVSIAVLICFRQLYTLNDQRIDIIHQQLIYTISGMYEAQLKHNT